MCTANYQSADSFTSYATSKDGGAELSTGLDGISDAFKAYGQVSANNAMIKAQQAAFLISADAYDTKARDVVEQGRDTNAWLGVRGRMEQGAARNQMSAAGVDVNFGSAKSYLTGLDRVNKVDRQTTRYKAMNAAFGFRNEALNMRQKAGNARMQKRNPFLTALAMGASSIYSGTQKLKNPKAEGK